MPGGSRRRRLAIVFATYVGAMFVFFFTMAWSLDDAPLGISAVSGFVGAVITGVFFLPVLWFITRRAKPPQHSD